MLIFKHRKYGVSKNYPLSAWAYRRLALNSGMRGLKFSAYELEEQYYFETYGKAKYKESYGKDCPDIRENGYTYGKSLFDITMSAIYQDLADGLFCKYDYLTDYSLPVIIRRNIKKATATQLFPYEKESRERNRNVL